MQITWTREEVILALDLVRQNDWWEIRPTDDRTKELSRRLQVPFAHPLDLRPENFRNANSVSRKTADLMTKLPHYRGRPTKGGRMDRLVIEEFLPDPQRLAATAEDLRARIDAGEWGAVPGSDAPLGVVPRATPTPAPATAVPVPSLAVATTTTDRGPTASAAPIPVEENSPAAGLALSLVTSAEFREQRARGGRHALEESLVEAMVAALVAAEGRTSQQRLAATIGLGAYSLEPTLAALRRLLNVEGYPVVSLDPDGSTVRLDTRLLREQFGLPATA